VPHNAIRYILGATSEGRHQLQLHPAVQLSYLDYMFIENDEGVRAWLLSNLALEDPLDLLVYGHRPATWVRPATTPLRGHDYLHENAVANWAQHAAGRHGLQAPPAELTPAQLMPWVKRQTTRRFVIQDQPVHHRLSLTLARDAKPALEHHHPRLEIPANTQLFIYHWQSHRYPK